MGDYNPKLRNYLFGCKHPKDSYPYYSSLSSHKIFANHNSRLY